LFTALQVSRIGADAWGKARIVSRGEEHRVIVSCRASVPAGELVVAAEVSNVLERRGALKHPHVSLAVSDAVALGIADIFRSDTVSGRVLDRFYRNGSIDSAELLEAARAEQGFASAEGHAALYCLIGWVHSRVHHQQAD
jgi:hypothetical protein